ncbi:MAG: AEC family transporter [Treponema sp.]|nr:AEC family transporter [Treponema sp.]
MAILVIKQLGIMTLIVLAGYVFARKFKIDDKEQKLLSKMLLYLINPCLIITSFNLEFDPVKLKELGFLVIVSTILHFLMIGIAILFTLKKSDINIIDRLSTVFTNCGFIGIPLIRGVFGNEGVFYLMGYLIVFNILLWTWGLYQMSSSINIKKIITNPNIIAVILGLAIFCLPFKLPQIIAQPISMIGDMNTPLAMLLIGIMFSNFQLEKTYLWKLLKISFLRLILVSLVNLLLLALINRIFGAGLQNCRTMLFVVYICSMCPVATSVPSMSCIFDKDSSYASLVVSVTSLLSMLTIPAFVALAEILL